MGREENLIKMKYVKGKMMWALSVRLILKWKSWASHMLAGKSALVLFHHVNPSVHYEVFEIRVLHLACMYLHLFVLANCTLTRVTIVSLHRHKPLNAHLPG